MSKKKEVLGRTGRFTQDERTTYTLQYKFDLGHRFVFLDQESFEGKVGHHFSESKDGKSTHAGSGRDFSYDEIESLIVTGKYEKGEYIKVIEYEADYE